MANFDKKTYILIQHQDDFGHFSATVREVRCYENLARLFDGYDGTVWANIYPTKKEAEATARCLNEGWHNAGVYKWDFMEDGTTPAPF